MKNAYCMEKIHGTSANIRWHNGNVTFFSGGSAYDVFIQNFDKEALTNHFIEMGVDEMTIWGEAYGGSMQAMRKTYGDKLKFIVFEVLMGEHCWLDVPNAEQIALRFGLDFVPYVKIPCTLEDIDAERDKPSVQAVKNGIEEPRKREGIVLRPLVELRKNNGERIICKHKNNDFMETKTARSIYDNLDKLKVYELANEIATEFCTEMRLTHVLDKFLDVGVEQTGEVIKAMIEDIEREGISEIVVSKEARKAISKETAQMFKRRIQNMRVAL